MIAIIFGIEIISKKILGEKVGDFFGASKEEILYI